MPNKEDSRRRTAMGGLHSRHRRRRRSVCGGRSAGEQKQDVVGRRKCRVRQEGELSNGVGWCTRRGMGAKEERAGIVCWG